MCVFVCVCVCRGGAGDIYLKCLGVGFEPPKQPSKGVSTVRNVSVGIGDTCNLPAVLKNRASEEKEVLVSAFLLTLGRVDAILRFPCVNTNNQRTTMRHATSQPTTRTAKTTCRLGLARRTRGSSSPARAWWGKRSQRARGLQHKAAVTVAAS